jgi:hypothetical protein
MSEAEYAQLASAFGAKIVCQGGVYWRRVRPFFYRTLLAADVPDEQHLEPPCRWLVGFQHLVRNPVTANSTMNFLVFDELRGYSLEALGHNRRRLIKNAAKSFQVRLIQDFQQLKDQGYPAYLAFFQRTRYSYKSDRVNRLKFDQWADTLQRFPKAILLGAFGSAGLTGVSVSYWVRDTLWYATLFNDSASLKQGVCELMLHELRRMVAQQPGISRIVARKYHGGNSLDRYYLLRGCKLVRLPARVWMSPGTLFLLKWLLPKSYAALCYND